MSFTDTITQDLISKGFTRQAAEELALKALETARKKKKIEERLRARRSTNYLDFLKDASPEMDWDTPFASYMSAVVDRIMRKELMNVLISLPPRSGKSELLTKRLPVHWIETRPSAKVIVGAYNHTLAKLFVGSALRIYRDRNPSDLDMSAEDEWSTVDGGSVRAVGVGSGVTGHGADLILVDDPTKSISEAFSKAYRDRVYNWYISDLRTRRNHLHSTPTLVIATRWHDQDLIGQILENSDPGEWEVINIPAIAQENDPLGREPGESINPVRLPLASLERERRLLGVRFDALYMGKPINESGTMFEIDKIVIVDETPRIANRVRFWDTAASEGKGDWTVGVLAAYDSDGIFWIEDMIRDRISRADVRKRMKDTLIDDLDRYGKIKGTDFKTYFEREPAGDGKTSAEDTIKYMAPYPIYSDRPSDNKTARSAGFSVAVNAGNVRMKRAPWNRDLLDELARFVAGIDNKNDDIVDSCSGGYNRLAIDNAIVTIR